MNFKQKLHKTSTFLLIYTMLVSLIISGQIQAEPKHLSSLNTEISLSKNVSQMPNLNGEKATTYLKENELYESLGEAIKAARYSINWIDKSPIPYQKGAFEAKNPNNSYTAYFQNDSVRLLSKNNNDDWQIEMKLKGFGYGNDISEVKSKKPKVQKDKTRIEIEKSSIRNPKSKITEWYENKPEGLEQGWTLNERPQNHASEKTLKLVLEIDGNLKPKLADDKQSLLLNKKDGTGTIRYEKLKAWDANGKDVQTTMELTGNKLTLLADEKNAVYPLTIDPLFTQAKKISASDKADNDEFGYAVAIDGDTVVIGALRSDFGGNTNRGSAYVFTRNEGGSNSWGEVKKLAPSTGNQIDVFGADVAISGDTIVVSALNISAGGNVYLFERNLGGIDNWGERKLISEPDEFIEVSIYNDTLVVGAYSATVGGNFAQGAAYIYERNQGGLNNWGQVKKIVASDGDENDRFGIDTSIDKDKIVIGASFDDVAPNLNQGSAYLFERNSGGADNWGQVNKFVASDGQPGSGFGDNVSISNDTVLIGADNAGGVAGDFEGAAYIFERNQGGINAWGEVKKMFASDGTNGRSFGNSVSIDNDTIIIGAQSDVVGTEVAQGSAYIFKRNQGGIDNWGEIKKLVSSDGQFDDLFGKSVSISGDMAVVGATGNSVNNNSDREGSAYIFRTDNLNWVESATTLATDGTSDDQLGFSVSISGDTAIVGAPNAEVNSNQFQGSAYIFVRNTNGADVWGQVAKITASDGNQGDEFGISVSICGDTAIVGAYHHNVGGTNTNQGAAYIYERNQGGANNWGQVTKITSTNGTTGDQFGISVSIGNDTAVVGANRDVVSGQTAQGSANIFYRNQFGADVWGEVKNLVASDGTAGDLFGSSVSISGDTVIIGAPQKDVATDTSAGAAYIFERNQGGIADNWGEVKKIVDNPVQASAAFGQSVAIDNDTVIIGSPLFDSFVATNIGSASIFERNTGGADNWGFVDFVLASDRNDNDEFGTSVSIDKDQVIVGSPFADISGNNDQGAAYIYERNRDGADAWGEFKKLKSSSGAGSDQFGISVAISRNHTIVGANRTDITSSMSKRSIDSTKDNLSGNDQGAAFIYRGNPLAPTAAGVNVGGKVLDSNGRRGLARTLVQLTNSSGQTKTTRTNQYGNFRFSDVTAGDTYTINAISKSYQFQPQVFNIRESINDLIIRPISFTNNKQIQKIN